MVVDTNYGELSHCQSATPIVAALPTVASQSGILRVKSVLPGVVTYPLTSENALQHHRGHDD